MGIQIDHVSKAFGAQPVLRDVSLSLPGGELTALLGPSGCGKTTLLNIISGLLRPTEGTVRFDEDDVTARPPDARNIAQVFQFPVVYDTMTVYDNLAFPLRNRGMGRQAVDERVREIAALLDLQLGVRFDKLSAAVANSATLNTVNSSTRVQRTILLLIGHRQQGFSIVENEVLRSALALLLRTAEVSDK